MVKVRILPTHHKKDEGCYITQCKRKPTFTAVLDSRKRGISQKKYNFISYEKALAYLHKKSKEFNLPIKNIIYDRGTHCECKLTQNQVMKFDKEDIDKVQKHVLCATKDVGSGSYYACTWVDKKVVRFHNIVMNHDPHKNKKFTVDHKVPGDTLNNQKKNLRLANRRAQSINHRTQKNNVSGHKGVYWSKSHKSWIAFYNDRPRHKIRKHFSIKNFGEKAKQMAIDYRAKMVSESDDYSVYLTMK
jgi:hypothetical protein